MILRKNYAKIRKNTQKFSVKMKKKVAAAFSLKRKRDEKGEMADGKQTEVRLTK